MWSKRLLIILSIIFCSIAFAGVIVNNDFIQVDNVKINGNTVSSESGDLILSPTSDLVIDSSSLDPNTALYVDNSKKLISSSVTNTELGYLSGVTSALQTQLDDKVDAITSFDNIIPRFDGTDGQLQTSAIAISDVGGVSGASTIDASTGITLLDASYLRFYEGAINGSNYVGLKAPSTLSSNITYTLPATDGTTGQALKTNGSGELSWGDVTASGGGSENYFEIEDADFEGDTVGNWYTDDGSDTGTPAADLTITTTDSANLAGSYSMYISKAADTAAGQKIQVLSKTIDVADRGKTLYGSFAYTQDANYTNGDLRFQVYDVTNDAMLRCNNSTSGAEILRAPSPSGDLQFWCETEATTAQVRFQFLVVDVSSTAWNVVVDRFRFNKSTKIKQQVQTKILSANANSDGAVSDLTFSSLQVGMWYEVKGKFRIQLDAVASDDSLIVRATHNSSVIDETNITIVDTGVNNKIIGAAVSFVFQAEDTSLTFVLASAGANSALTGNGTRSYTYVQLIPRPDLY